MPIGSFLNRFYTIKVTCVNCGKPCEIKIKKGTDVGTAIAEKSLICDNCGCIIKPTEYQTQWLR